MFMLKKISKWKWNFAVGWWPHFYGRFSNDTCEYIIYQSLGSSYLHGMSRILSTYVQILANLDGNVSTSSSQVHP